MPVGGMFVSDSCPDYDAIDDTRMDREIGLLAVSATGEAGSKTHTPGIPTLGDPIQGVGSRSRHCFVIPDSRLFHYSKHLHVIVSWLAKLPWGSESAR